MDILQTSQETLTCLICQDIFMDPVFLRCGHTFCKACLIFISEDIRILDLCPKCREPSHQMFTNNITMKTRVSTVREHRIMKYLSSEDHKCVIHKEKKTKFCSESRTLLCQLCSDSQDHRGHRHCTIELRVTKQMDFMTLRKKMIRSEYRKLHPPHDEEENKQMKWMKNQSNSISEELMIREALMVHNRSQLIKLYQELKAMYKKPYEVLLLQLVSLKQSELVHLTQCMNPKLIVLPNTGLAARFNHFQVKIFFQNLVLFNCQPRRVFNFRRLSFRPRHDNPFLDVPGSYRTSWGAESFTTGKYYWELDLKDHEQWAVGVCYNFWLRNFDIGSEGAFLLVCLKDGDVYSLLTTCPSLHHYIEKPAGRVGVFLDCEGGYVSFLDVAKSSLIYSYCPGTFYYTVRPYYCTVYTWS
ncbi:tripartite motif-containing protein 43C-like [Apodemus sylvaticus]|uniref:tripartite motif-containing protein 43C-like n=1 Tax=Apodemus sylvaticus TaxID=10129 RepID=UPI0022439C82|nr:tripartite motif-containing protein 43C-like [Apodemus sylvaticus]